MAPDNRGAGDSSIRPDSDYTAATAAEDLRQVLDFLNVSSACVVAHDKGSGFAAKLQTPRCCPSTCSPGFGYEGAAPPPAPSWISMATGSWAFFGVPHAAAFFTQGRGKELLLWCVLPLAAAAARPACRPTCSMSTPAQSPSRGF